MKRYFALVVAMIFLLVACGQTELVDYHCDICGADHRNLEQASGNSTRNAAFEVWAYDSSVYLRIYVESCWVGSVAPQARLYFISQYDIAELYAAISIAESNVPFEVTLDNEMITLTTDVLGLEKVYITLAERQWSTGFSYDMRRHGE